MEKSEEKKSDDAYIAKDKTPLQKVGEFLREARQSRNLSLEDLSSSLRIGKEQLIALEDGNESSLPEKVFIRAMVRRIAEKLNLDTSFIFEALNEKKNNENRNTNSTKNETRNKYKNLNQFSMIFISGVLGLLTSVVLLRYIERNQNESIYFGGSEIYLSDKNIFFK